MPPNHFKVKTDLKEVRKMLRQIEFASADLTKVFKGPINSSLTQFFFRQFASQGLAGGEPWAPLTPVTKQLKARDHRERMGVLRDRNRLWSSLSKSSGPLTYVRVTPDELERGTLDPKAIYHQEGFTQTKIFNKQRRFPRTVKPRPLIPSQLPLPLVKSWESLIVKHLLAHAAKGTN